MHLCASCQRHVREATCPFCGASDSVATSAGAPFSGLSRARWLAGSALAGAALAACASHNPAPMAIYGGPPTPDALPEATDAGAAEPVDADDAGLTRTPLPPPTMMPMYGMPPAH